MAIKTSTRLLEDSDIEQVLELMRLSLGEPRLLARTPELFRWKHFDNPFGRSIALVAEEGGRLIGLRTFMRWSLQTPDGHVLQAIRAVDTATHPEHQRKGIFRRLTEEAVEVAKDDGVDMIFNTPNEKSKPGYLKMGWREVGAIGALLRPSRALLKRGEDQLDDPHFFLHSPVPVMTVDLVDRVPKGLRTPRTAEYLAWRFTGHPTARYYMAGENGAKAILRPNVRKGRHELVVADIFGPPHSAARAAVKAATGNVYLATWFAAGSPERKAVMRRGFLPVPRMTALNLVMRPLTDLPESYWSPATWDTAVSDFELL